MQIQGVAAPTWSTTGPSVVAGPTSILETLEFDHDWVNISHDESSFAASYSWWVGFLESLDGPKNDHKELEKLTLDNGNGLLDLGQAHKCYFDVNEASSSSGSLDEWVENPNSDDSLKGELLVNEVLN